MSRPTLDHQLQAARDRVSRAWEECPHWDYDTDGEPDAPYACCQEIRDARAAVRQLRRDIASQEG